MRRKEISETVFNLGSTIQDIVKYYLMGSTYKRQDSIDKEIDVKDLSKEANESFKRDNHIRILVRFPARTLSIGEDSLRTCKEEITKELEYYLPRIFSKWPTLYFKNRKLWFTYTASVEWD